jgi:hypothetical protein
MELWVWRPVVECLSSIGKALGSVPSAADGLFKQPLSPKTTEAKPPPLPKNIKWNCYTHIAPWISSWSKQCFLGILMQLEHILLFCWITAWRSAVWEYNSVFNLFHTCSYWQLQIVLQRFLNVCLGEVVGLFLRDKFLWVKYKHF